MADRFTVRVVLHHAEEDLYHALHEAMEGKHFKRSIELDGAEYEMPPGEYNYLGASTANDVCDAAVEAAGSIWKDFSVLVSPSGLRVGWELKPYDRAYELAERARVKAERLRRARQDRLRRLSE